MGNLRGFYKRLDQYYAQNNLGGAEQFLQESVERSQVPIREVIAAYNELGSLYRSTGQYAQSLSAFEKARELAEKVLGPTCTQYATVLNNMAGTCRLMQNHNKAIELFQQAIEIYHKVGETTSYAYASVLNNLSLAYRETNQLEEAIKCLEEALTLIETMPEHQQEITVTYNNLTILYHATGNYYAVPEPGTSRV